MKTQLFLIIAIIFTFSFNTQAQNRIFKKKQIDAQLGLGVLPTYFMDDGKTEMIPITANIDYFIHDVFTVGISFGYSAYNAKEEIESDGILVHRKNQTAVVAIRSAAHITRIDNWDFYGGFQAGYHFIKINSDAPADMDIQRGIKPQNNAFVLGGHLGAKYAFSKKIHAFTEIGFDISILKLGIGMKI